MRNLCVFWFLAAELCQAGEFFNGMAARAVIGQRTFTEQASGASDTLIGAVSGIAFGNGKLVLVDDNRVSAAPQNSRVLIFNDVLRFIPKPTDELDQPPDNYVRCLVCVGRADVVLGQPDFTTTATGVDQTKMNRPTGVATDGNVLVVADTDNNRILLWRNIPTSTNQPADIVLGQPDFKSRLANEGKPAPSNRAFRGPQGVWIQGTRLYVADSQNNRVMVWRTIPTQNFQPADIVLGQPNFTTATTQNLSLDNFKPTAASMLEPVSVTSDGRKLFVTDLGYNRVLIWNNIPDANSATADVVVGQPDMTSGDADNTKNLCLGDHTKDADGNDVPPISCKASLNFPRYALSDGTRLFVADGGNDRVLIFNNIPTQNGQEADVIVGQIAGNLNQVSDSANPIGRGSADSVATPMGLAWDGTNLYVSDPFRRRVLVFTPGELLIPYTGVRNLFSRDIFAIGTITFAGTVKEGDEVTVKIGDEEGDPKQRSYKYKIVKDDTFGKVIGTLIDLINADSGDPQVLATANTAFSTLVLTARKSGSEGNAISIATTTSENAEIQLTTSGATLSGGQNAAQIAPGTLVTILGNNLSDRTESAPDVDPLPRELGGVQVYFDGIRAPLLSVSPDEIRAQMPWDVNDANSISAYLRIQRNGGIVVSTAAVAVPIIPQNPGIMALDGTDPRPGIITHFSSRATATVSVDGTANKDDVATINIEDRAYTYKVVENDTLDTIRDKLIELINANPDEKVEAFVAGVFDRIRLRAKVEGPEGNGIRITTAVNDGGQVILTATNSATCCANVAGTRVTEDNPALPGETIVVIATGLGVINPEEAKVEMATGFKFKGAALNRPDAFVSSLAGGKTANVLYSGLAPGLVGIYEVHLELNSDIPSNPATQVTIAQDIYVSNIVTFPVWNPNDSSIPPSATAARSAINYPRSN
ncbi:MAG: hypothetical protein HY820_30155 [Acidobacteria bacterium]|nr:hypothetical protein [Acidobacteriota bacterium]